MKTTTKTFLLFAVTLFFIKTTAAQTPCSYDFTYTVNGTNVVFNNTPNVTAPVSSVIWTFDTLQFSTANDPTYTGATPGYHVACMVVIDLMCINPTIAKCDTIFIAGGTIGISEKELSKSIHIFPNPSSGKVNLVSSFANVETIAVFNALGAIVFEEKEPQLQNELDLTTLPNGIYIVKTKTEAGTVTKKINIQK